MRSSSLPTWVKISSNWSTKKTMRLSWSFRKAISHQRAKMVSSVSALARISSSALVVITKPATARANVLIGSRPGLIAA